MVNEILKNFVKQTITKSCVAEKWHKSWAGADSVDNYGFNVVSGEVYTSFDNHCISSDLDQLYITVPQAKERYSLAKADITGFTRYAGRFSHTIEGLSNHGKNARAILSDPIECAKLDDLEKIVLQERANLIEERHVSTRHYVLSVCELLKKFPDNKQINDDIERYGLFEVGNNLPYLEVCEQHNIKVFTGEGRQAVNSCAYKRNKLTNEITFFDNRIILGSTFEDQERLLGVYFHELTHAISKCCNAYFMYSKSFEEATAELGSHYLAMCNGVKHIEDRYIAGWLGISQVSDLSEKKINALTDSLEKRMLCLGAL